MGILDQVSQMRTQGYQEDQIIQELQDQGISPKAINDALSQSQIKNAISDQDNMDEYQNPTESNPEIGSPSHIRGKQYNPGVQEMGNNMGQEVYDPNQEQYQDEDPGYSQQEYYPQEDYSGGGYGYSQPQDYSAGGGYSDTIIEVSEQVFSKKIKKIQRQLDDVIEFKALSETKIESFEKRLKRIEQVIDKLQISILDRIGSYGKNLDSIKREMSMMQDSFGKMINPLVESNKRAAHHHSSPTHSFTSSTTRKKITRKK